VVQEALSNAVRHGRPDRISVTLQREAGQIIARVVDAGAKQGSPAPGDGQGLTGMRERMEAVGGVVVIESSRPDGWTVTARAPCGPDGVSPAKAIDG
jgi:two-component system sensor histidine kinase UhpB